MFDLFRSRDKAVRILLGGLLLLVGLSMLTYLIPGGPSMGSSGTDMVVAEIGKDAITIPEVQQIIQLNTRSQRLPPELLAHYVPEYINSMVTERALAYEAQRLGYKVSNAELAAAIRETLPQLFPNGKFAGKEAYEQVLAQQNLTIEQFESDLGRQLLTMKLRGVAGEGIVVTPQEIAQEYHRRNDKIKVEYVKIPADKLRAQVQVTPAELQKYYDDHKPLYQVPEKRDLGILLIDQAKLEQTIQPTEADLQRVYNENRDHYRTPERVDVRHILLKTDAKDPKSDAAVKAKAESLVKQLRAGANFAEMAKKYSEDPGSAAKGGEYDGVVRGQMVPEFEKAAFSLKPGEISDPVKTTYGYHILQVIKHEPAQLKTFESVKNEIASEYKKQRVNDLMQQTSDNAQAALTKDPLHPEKIAAQLNIQYIKADQVGPGTSIPEIGTSKEFDESISTLKKGEVSQPVLLTGNKYVMAVVTGDTPAHPAAFAEVESKVRDGLIKDETDKLVAAKAKELADKVQANGGDLAAAAKSMGFEMKTSAEVDRAGAIEGLGSAAMLTDAFVKPVGAIIGPVAVADSKVVAKIVDKVPADAAGLAAQSAGIRDQIRGQRGQLRNALFEEGVRDALTKEGKIKIHEDVMNRLIANYRG
ncbi:MAG TPA: peptidyl-prolyl cis-trans isomerase [Bryobacteraceae bacterium]|nr:peptidyl-prolyl cis-trans isomerase [Bryobacteraceae bacterium]